MQNVHFILVQTVALSLAEAAMVIVLILLDIGNAIEVSVNILKKMNTLTEENEKEY